MVLNEIGTQRILSLTFHQNIVTQGIIVTKVQQIRNFLLGAT